MTAPGLGTTRDPRTLVPGDPAAVGRTAAAMTAYGNSLTSAGDGLGRIGTTEGWSGPAAEEFRSAYDGEPRRWLEAGDCFHYAGGALNRYRAVLLWAQDRAADAIRLWDQGEAASRTAATGQPDPGDPPRRAAEDLLGRVRDQLTAAGDEAAHVVRRARDLAPDERGWPERAGDAVHDVAAAAINGVASFGNAALNHPEYALGLAAGGGLVAVSAVGEVGGVALDATGVGAVAGIPLGVVSTAGIVFGAGLGLTSAAAIASEAGGDDAVEVVQPSAADETAEPALPWEDPAVRDKIPEEWGDGRANNKGVGHRWDDPQNVKGTGIRIDRGEPDVSQPIQQGDHVVVRDNGRIIGRDGKPLTKALRAEPERGHIPLEEWKRWSAWNHP